MSGLCFSKFLAPRSSAPSRPATPASRSLSLGDYVSKPLCDDEVIEGQDSCSVADRCTRRLGLPCRDWLVRGSSSARLFAHSQNIPLAVHAQGTDDHAHDHRCKEDGLTNAEADRRREIFGPNKLESKETSAILQFLSCVLLLAFLMPCAP